MVDGEGLAVPKRLVVGVTEVELEGAAGEAVRTSAREGLGETEGEEVVEGVYVAPPATRYRDVCVAAVRGEVVGAKCGVGVMDTLGLPLPPVGVGVTTQTLVVGVRDGRNWV